MKNTIRIATTLAAFAAAVASQAVLFSFQGQSTSGVSVPPSATPFTTTPPAGAISPSGSPFNQITSGQVTLNGATSFVTFTNAGSGQPAGTVTVSFNGTTDDFGTGLFSLSSVGTITAATGVYLPYVSPTNTLTVTSNTQTATAPNLNFFSVLGNVTAVPEPTSVAALAIGGLGLVARRRRKA